MDTKKQPGPTLWSLLSASVAFLTLMIGCTGPTAELSATNTPTIAAATATVPPETPTPTRIPAAREITEDSDLFINSFEALKAKYVVGNDTEFAQLPEFIEVPDGHQIWLSEGTITDRESMTIYPTGSIVIFSASGEAFVLKNNIDFEEVEDPGFGYTMSFQTDENGNFVTNPFVNDTLTLIATFVDGSETLFWNTNTNVWEEEIKEYASAGEALVALGDLEVWRNEDGSIRFYIDTNTWEEYKDKTGFTELSPFCLPEGVDKKDVEKIINDFFLEGVKANNGDIAVRHIDTNEFMIVNVLTEDEKLDPKFKFIFISGVGKKETPHVQLPPNPDVERLFLPLKSNGNSTGSQYGIFFIPETNTFVVYTEIHWQSFTQESHEDPDAARKDMMDATHEPLLALALLIAPPDKMEQFLNIKEYAERKDIAIFSDFLGKSTPSWQMQRELHDLTENTTVWKIWD